MINVIRSMFSMALKTNPYLKFAVITGYLRIAKESIFTGTNNFVFYSIADREFPMDMKLYYAMVLHFGKSVVW